MVGDGSHAQAKTQVKRRAQNVLNEAMDIIKGEDVFIIKKIVE